MNDLHSMLKCLCVMTAIIVFALFFNYMLLPTLPEHVQIKSDAYKENTETNICLNPVSSRYVCNEGASAGCSLGEDYELKIIAGFEPKFKYDVCLGVFDYSSTNSPALLMKSLQSFHNVNNKRIGMFWLTYSEASLSQVLSFNLSINLIRSNQLLVVSTALRPTTLTNKAVLDVSLLARFAYKRCLSFMYMPSGASVVYDFVPVLDNLKLFSKLSAISESKDSFYLISPHSLSSLLIFGQYIERFSNFLLSFSAFNRTLYQLAIHFSASHVVSPPQYILPFFIMLDDPLIQTQEDLHKDMAVKKTEMSKIPFKIKAMSSELPTKFPYIVEYISEQYGFFHTQSVMQNDRLTILFDRRVNAQALTIFSGYPKAEGSKIKKAYVEVTSTGDLNLRTQRVACTRFTRSGDFINGVATLTHSINGVRCIRIVFETPVPNGIAIYQILAT